MNRLLLCLTLVAMIAAHSHAGQIGSKFDVTFYGFIQGDVIYTDHDPADIADGFANNIAVDSRGDLNFSAQNTRLGFDFKVPTENDWTVTGKVEGDFANTALDANTTSNAVPRLRHAYVSADQPKWGILAGQTWMVLAPQTPPIVNAGSFTWTGNLFGRYPQVRLTARPAPFKVELAVLKMTNSNVTSSAHTLTEEPRYQARISWNGDLPFAKKAVFGVSGDLGKYGLTTGKIEQAATSHTLALDLVLPISRVTLSGEYFWAQNANAVGGSCNEQPTHQDSEITSTGGWANVNIKLTDKWWLNAGYSTEQNDRDQLVAADVTRNSVVYGNLGYKLTSAVSLIGEYNNQRTVYNGMLTQENNRYQFTVKYDF